jgi:hypothetical protein
MALIDQAQLEQRIGGAEYLLRFTDDDRDGVADASVVAGILDEASQLAIGHLWAGFPSLDLIDALVASDVAVAGAIGDIACGLAGQRRPEFVNQQTGEPVFGWRRVQGERVLRDIGAARRNAAGEATVGPNQINHMRPSRSIATAPFTFSTSSRDRKGPGGF